MMSIVLAKRPKDTRAQVSAFKALQQVDKANLDAIRTSLLAKDQDEYEDRLQSLEDKIGAKKTDGLAKSP
jgi:hypothetical protein